MSLNLMEVDFSETTEEKPDWAFATQPEVGEIARRAARRAGDQYGNTLEAEDALQEALMVLATRASAARSAFEKGSGALFRWIGQRLRDSHLTEAKHRSVTKSWEVNQDQLETLGY